MKFDTFFSICQTPVNGYTPNERTMWLNFFDQVRTADDLGIETAWVAETHLSCQVQKRNPGAVIPHFEGEIGLNTDILQVAHKVFAQTKKIHVGSAIRNILCNGGPIAHAEAIKTFLSLHGLDTSEDRLLHLGFASGRFPFSNVPYGIRPRTEVEKLAWPVLRGLIFMEATEIFLRFLRGDIFSSRDVRPKILRPEMFRKPEDWRAVALAHGGNPEQIVVDPFWVFDDVGVIPYEAPLHLLRLVIGAHDAASQNWANQFMPVGVFNLSITPAATIEEVHTRMQTQFHPTGGLWTRSCMPRTVLVFIDQTVEKAQKQAEDALSNYWRAIEGTLDPEKIKNAVDNALVGTPNVILEQMNERFHPDDRLMLWFDFNNHDNEFIKRSMKTFMEKVAPLAKGNAKQGLPI